MPASREILAGLITTANQWQTIAFGWHLLFGALIVAFCLGWRPSARLASVLLSLPLLSVSALAWWSDNPFNAAVFAIVTLRLAGLGIRLPLRRVPAGCPWLVGSGATLVAFGWIYPHFLNADSWLSYLYVAPLGVIPCPTLAAVIGLVFILGMSRFRMWSGVLAGLGVLYGAFGWLRLGVTIDVVLLAGAAMLAGVAAAGPRIHCDVSAASPQTNGATIMRKTFESLWGALQIAFHLALGPMLHRWRIRWGATDEEIRRTLPGDGLVPAPAWSYNHAITIEAPRSAVWPWLLQLGQRRGGFYSYEGLENLIGCDIHNVQEIRPGLQQLAVGDTVRMHRSGFGPPVTVLEAERALVLGGPADSAGSRATWSFHLFDGPDGTTRLLERGRSAAGIGALAKLVFGPYLMDPIGFVMSRKMLHTIKGLAERTVQGRHQSI